MTGELEAGLARLAEARRDAELDFAADGNHAAAELPTGGIGKERIGGTLDRSSLRQRCGPFGEGEALRFYDSATPAVADRLVR